MSVLVALLLGVSGCVAPCEDFDVCELSEKGNVEVSFYGFTPTELGGEQIREIRFESLGPDPLWISVDDLVEEDGDGQDELFAVGWDGERWQGPTFELEPGESATLKVAYRPQNQVEDRGYVELRTNDPDQRDLRVELRPPAPRPELFVHPEALVWGAVPPQSDPNWRGEPRTLEVQNLGTASLEISDIRIEGDDVFDWELQQCNFAPDGGRSCPPEDDISELPGPISLDESAYLRVWYRPVDRLPRNGTLLISCRDDDDTTVEVPLETR
ncbi:MAG: hypothetical protein ACQEVA_22020 [Myxococcota bacterium]